MNAFSYSCHTRKVFDTQALTDFPFSQKPTKGHIQSWEELERTWQFETTYDFHLPGTFPENIETTIYRGQEIPVFEVIKTTLNERKVVSEEEIIFDVGNAGYAFSEEEAFFDVGSAGYNENGITKRDLTIINEDIFHLKDHIQPTKKKEICSMEVHDNTAIREALEKSIETGETVSFLLADVYTANPNHVNVNRRPPAKQARPKQTQPREKKLILRLHTTKGSISLTKYPIIYRKERELKIDAQITLDIRTLLQEIEDEAMFYHLSRLAEEHNILLVTKTFKVAGVDLRDDLKEELYYIEPHFLNIHETHMQGAYN